MRVIAAEPGSAPATRIPRILRFECLGLAAASAVVLAGVALTSWGRLAQLPDQHSAMEARIVNLSRLRSPDDVAPILTMFGHPAERETVARAVYARAAMAPPLEHVGGLATVSVSAREIAADRRLETLAGRLRQRSSDPAVRVFTPADIAALKPALVVRTRREFATRIFTSLAGLLGAFWFAHVIRRWRRAEDDPAILPVLMLLSGVGLMSMIGLRDPLRDTVIASPFVAGVAGGVLLLLAASEIDVEASRLRRAVLAPLALALACAALLLVFGTGPGRSGVKVNLFGVQPVEAIRLFVVFSLAAYFARRLEFLRELSQPLLPAQPRLRHLRMPRWKDVRPVVVSMALVLTFFFLQKDLGPALVLSFVFLALYGIARGRPASIVAGFGILTAGFMAAYWMGFPATVRQRVAIWFDPWSNGVPGGNQIAHGLWALATGAVTGSGGGTGSPQSIPAAHTDFVLAAVGEELGFVGFIVVVALYSVLTWRCIRIATRAPGDYTAFLAVGLTLALIVQALVIASGLLGLLPLAGVVTPFLSYGRSSMLANFLAIGAILAVARRQGRVRGHLSGPVHAVGAVLAIAAVAVAARAAWVQVVHADRLATASSLTEQADGRYRFEYNPRLVSAARLIVRGTIYDRGGLPLATSRADEIARLGDDYRRAGVAPERPCHDGAARCYPLAGLTFTVLGDWNTQTNWGARNSSYLERDLDAHLKGYDDRQQIVEVINRRTGETERAVRRDYRELLPLARARHALHPPAVRALLSRQRDMRASIDARLQVRAAAALGRGIRAGGHTRGAAVVLDVDSGDVLASVNYPWPSTEQLERQVVPARGDDADPWLDRSRYGLYPPGSIFKLLVAAAALARAPAAEREFACVRLPDGRVGNYVRGWPRPVRDDPLHGLPHGVVGLRRGLVVSCNAYFAQLAMQLGAEPISTSAALFQIDTASPSTVAALRRTLPQAGYGQGDVLVSPLKMARVAASIAAGGAIRPARWVTTPEPPVSSGERLLAEPRAALLGGYMREAVTSGSARSLAANSTAIAGKTGTAEVADAPAHSWFVGFAPFDGDRRIAFAVLVEHAGYGARAAAPIAGEIVSAARDLGLFSPEEAHD